MRFAITFIVFISVVVIMSCSKGNNNNNTIVTQRIPDSTVIMYATLDSAVWQADSVSGLLIPIGNDSGHYNLSITAKKAANSTVMNLYIGNYSGMGTYTINPPAVAATFYSGAKRHYALSGTIVISNDSTADMQGTYNFIADSANGLKVSNGVFRFPL
jgi:hypothetical protein